MKKLPTEITLCTLDVLLMPNGEILCLGKALGWFKEFGKYLNVVDKNKSKKK